MKRIKIVDYYFEEISAGSAWVIFDIICPYCNTKKHVKTINYMNGETKQKCECGKKILVILN